MQEATSSWRGRERESGYSRDRRTDSESDQQLATGASRRRRAQGRANDGQQRREALRRCTEERQRRLLVEMPEQHLDLLLTQSVRERRIDGG